MKRLVFVFSLLVFFMLTGMEVFAMPAKVTETVLLPQVEEEFKKLFGRSIIVGPAAPEGSELAKYAAANEFGATITPKSARALAIPLTPEAKESRPGNFTDLFVLKTEKAAFLARKRGDGVELMYILKKSVEIPERSYLRSALDKKDSVDRAMNLASAALNRLIAGTGTAEDVLNAIGLSLVASVKKNIASGIGPPNSSLTVNLKRGDTTLIGEGRLLNSIQHEVV